MAKGNQEIAQSKSIKNIIYIFCLSSVLNIPVYQTIHTNQKQYKYIFSLCKHSHCKQKAYGSYNHDWPNYINSSTTAFELKHQTS